VSASREKKARQETGKELTPKQLKAQQDAKKAKRNTIIYSVVGVVCAVLVAALLIWNSGFFQKRAAAITVGGVNYPAVDVQYYYSQIANEWYSYAQYGYVTNLDVNTAPDQQMYDDTQTWHDMFLEDAISTVSQYKVLAQQAKRQGLTLTEEEQAAVQEQIDQMTVEVASSGYASLEDYLKAAYGSHMDMDKFKELLTESAVASKCAQQYSNDLSYTDQELEDYFTEHKEELELFKYGYVLFDGSPETKKDAEGNTISATEEEKKAALDSAKKKADAFAKDLTNGTSYDEATKAYEEDTKVTIYKMLSFPGASVSSLYADWVRDEARKEGDVTVVENSSGTGYYVVYFVSRGRDTEITGDIRHALIAADMDEGATVPTEAQYEAAKKKAEDLLAQWKKSGGTEEAFAELAKAESADASSAVNGGLMTGVSTESGYVTEFANWVADPERKPGDTGIVKNDGSSVKGYHIMYYVAPNEPLWKVNVRNQMKTEAATTWLEGLLEEANVTRKDGLKYVG